MAPFPAHFCFGTEGGLNGPVYRMRPPSNAFPHLITITRYKSRHDQSERAPHHGLFNRTLVLGGSPGGAGGIICSRRSPSALQCLAIKRLMRSSCSGGGDSLCDVLWVCVLLCVWLVCAVYSRNIFVVFAVCGENGGCRLIDSQSLQRNSTMSALISPSRAKSHMASQPCWGL